MNVWNFEGLLTHMICRMPTISEHRPLDAYMSEAVWEGTIRHKMQRNDRAKHVEGSVSDMHISSATHADVIVSLEDTFCYKDNNYY